MRGDKISTFERIDSVCLSCTIYETLSYLLKVADLHLPHLHWDGPLRISFRCLRVWPFWRNTGLCQTDRGTCIYCATTARAVKNWGGAQELHHFCPHVPWTLVMPLLTKCNWTINRYKIVQHCVDVSAVSSTSLELVPYYPHALGFSVAMSHQCYGSCTGCLFVSCVQDR